MCENTDDLPLTTNIPVPDPVCPDPEPCDTGLSSDCVFVSRPIPAFDIEKDERLTSALEKIAVNKDNNPIDVDDTDTVDLSGSGLSSDKLKADVKIDPDSYNLIKKTSKGLISKFDYNAILALLRLVISNKELTGLWCTLNSICKESTCDFTTNMEILMQGDTLVVDAGPDLSLQTAVPVITLSGTIAGGTPSDFGWTQISGPSGAVIKDSKSLTTRVHGLDLGRYAFRLSAIDSNGNSSVNDVNIVNGVPANIPPVANAGDDLVITLPLNSVTLTGTISNDIDGHIVSYLWTKASGPDQYNINQPNLPNTVVNNLTEGVYVFKLKVIDDKGSNGEDTVVITVNANVTGNVAPIANAGADIAVTLPTNQIILDGTLSHDPDGSIVTYSWTKQSGPACVITNPSQMSTSVTGLNEGNYVFQLEVSDNLGIKAVDVVNVAVSPATQSTFTANYGWFDSDPTASIMAGTPLTWAGSVTVPLGNDIEVDFRASGPEKFFVIQEDKSEPIKTKWFNTQNNQGPIPDYVWKAPFEVGSKRYYVTPDTRNMDSSATTILKKV
jgi:hypothetical protein